jgi:hypothetical protein
MSQIGALLDSMPDDELRREKPLKARLKYGKRNMILAVVDMGVVSNLRFSEADFGGGSRWKLHKHWSIMLLEGLRDRSVNPRDSNCRQAEENIHVRRLAV